MRPHHKTHEWFAIASLLVITVIIYLLYTTGQLASQDITISAEIFSNMINLMVLSAIIVMIIVLLRIYGRLEEISKHTAPRR